MSNSKTLSRTRKHLVAILVAAATVTLALSTAPTANAALILDLQNGATVVTDGGAGDLDGAVNGKIISSSLVAGFGVTITIAESNSPGASTGLLQVSSLDVQNLGAVQSTLQIRVSDTNYTLPGVGGSSMLLDSDIGGTFTQGVNGDTVRFTSYADPNNGQPATAVSTVPLTFLRTLVPLTESFSGSDTMPWVRNAGPYSLANIAEVTLSPGGQVNLSGTTTASLVPEPASFVAMIAFGAMLQLRRRKSLRA